MGGSGTSTTTNNPGGGDGSTTTSAMGGSGMVNPTSAMGGSAQSMGGGSSTSGASTGGAGTDGGDTGQGGKAMTGGTGGTGPMGPKCLRTPPAICHEFLANDNSRNQVNYVNEFEKTDEQLKATGGVVWHTVVGHATPAPENSPRTIEIVDNAKATGGKAVLVSVNDGYVELDLKTGMKLADVTVQFSGVTGACRITADGSTALGTNASMRIVNAQGVQLTTFPMPNGSNLRAINRNPTTGDFWLSKTETVYQLNKQGQILWQGFMGAGTKGYAVWWRDGGGMYGTTGEPATVVELDKDGKIVATVGGRTAFPELNLDFFSGFVRMPNGNYIVANWLGHLGSPGANTAEIIEFQPDKADPNKSTAIWTWGNQTLARQITNVYVFQ
jgi:hypothetical protein